MTISRRMALTGASAFAVVGGMSQSSLASAATRVMKALTDGRNYRNTQTSQRFLQLLIHQHETGRMPVSAEISIPARDTAWYAINTMDATKYRMTNNAYKKRGYRLRWVNAFKTKEGVRYAACWELMSGPDWHSRHGMTAAEFNKTNAKFAKQGFRLAYIDTRVQYSAIWERGDATSQQVLTELTQSQFEQQYKTLTAQGFRPLRISAAAANGSSSFAAILEKNTGPNWQAGYQMGAADFRKMNANMRSQGYRLTDASGHMLGRKQMFSGVWEII